MGHPPDEMGDPVCQSISKSAGATSLRVEGCRKPPAGRVADPAPVCFRVCGLAVSPLAPNYETLIEWLQLLEGGRLFDRATGSREHDLQRLAAVIGRYHKPNKPRFRFFFDPIGVLQNEQRVFTSNSTAGIIQSAYNNGRYPGALGITRNRIVSITMGIL